MSHILVVVKGSNGDFFPMCGIARALAARGHCISFAVQERLVEQVRVLGYPVAALDRTGWENAASSTRFFSRLVRGSTYLWPTRESMRLEMEVLLDAGKDADIIIGTQTAFMAPAVARKLGIPWVYCGLSPMSMLSYRDPPMFPGLHGLQRLSRKIPATQWPYIAIARNVTRCSTLAVAAERRNLLGVSGGGHPLFEGMFSSALNLLLISPALVDAQPDWPSATVIAGFAWFEADSLENPEHAKRLDAFLDAGPPPIVFTLAAVTRTGPGQFFAESIKVCEKLGVRGVLVAAPGPRRSLPNTEQILTVGPVAFSTLFPRARAVVHSGGIGTIGRCLRSGVPSLLAPARVDQFDNAYRLQDRGLAQMLPHRRYRAAAAASRLNDVLNDAELRPRLQALATRIAAEDGAAVAAERIDCLARAA